MKALKNSRILRGDESYKEEYLRAYMYGKNAIKHFIIKTFKEQQLKIKTMKFQSCFVSLEVNAMYAVCRIEKYITW